MLTAADEHFAGIPGICYERPKGGLYVWLELPEHIDTGTDGELFRRAMEAGVLYVPGGYCYPDEGERPRNNMIRLSFGVSRMRILPVVSAASPGQSVRSALRFEEN